MVMSWDQILSLFGAALLLGAYALQAATRDGAHKKTYLTMNLFGSAALTVTAVVNNQLGFIILEGIWAIISAVSLLKVLRQKPS
ncbi:MAG TPA: hypothetical protein VFO10_08500 [Oligoflexus sp.]|uniref:CBU_0592 family membrane protein n=1 Tax=Oligoflexus sp. TaxID=1971216 RepID=UPI002D7EFC74|nr:hypothetical protein [Oligoflexus sp.]HET9237278.1 hypothetical protein [Oligoflexus sp.]